MFPAATASGQSDAAKRLSKELEACPHRILYETYRNDNWEIYVCDASGRRARNLTRTPDTHELYPQASPDGRKIAFVSDELRGGKKIRCVSYMSSDGSGRTLVAENARQPCWSPDSTEIAFLKGQFDAFTVKDFATKGLFFFDVAGGRERQHPNGKLHHLYNPCWTPDGRWIIATVHGGMGYGHAILAIEVDGKGVYDLKIGGCRPDVSSDGKRICWGRNDNTISIADIGLGGSVPRLTNQRDLVKDALHVYHSDWSPDGKYITFSRGPGGRKSPNGPGTHRGIAEIVGVRAEWNVCIVPVSGGSGWVQLTRDGQSNKESDWLATRTAAGASQ